MNAKRAMIITLLAIWMGWVSPTGAVAEDNLQSLMNFLVGSYDLIGRKPDSSELYAGVVTIQRHGDTLFVERVINGKTVVGRGRIAHLAGDAMTALRVRFSEAGNPFEATYQINADPNNYGRLSGFVYTGATDTQRAGLEALFNQSSYR